MTDMFSIRDKNALLIKDGTETRFAGNQEWYSTERKRLSGCGPTTCSAMMWYLAQTHAGCAPLSPFDGSDRQGFTRLMEDVWHYTTPGRMGLNSTERFATGAERYGAECGVPLKAHVLDVPEYLCQRPSYEQVQNLLEWAFVRDLPVAFLNFSNGALHNLDNWHWVLLVALKGGSAQMYDQGEDHMIRLEKWLRTTTLGGGFVVLQPAAEERQAPATV